MEEAKNVAKQASRAPEDTSEPVPGPYVLHRVPSDIYEKSVDEQEERNKYVAPPQYPEITPEALAAKQLAQRKEFGYTGWSILQIMDG